MSMNLQLWLSSLVSFAKRKTPLQTCVIAQDLPVTVALGSLISLPGGSKLANDQHLWAVNGFLPFGALFWFVPMSLSRIWFYRKIKRVAMTFHFCLNNKESPKDELNLISVNSETWMLLRKMQTSVSPESGDLWMYSSWGWTLPAEISINFFKNFYFIFREG